MIRVLDAETIGQIAAGEVIERPVSVVKELVENALDADATRIAVRARGGGLVEIEVADDGIGIAPDQVALALRRHATSKLDDAAALTRIDTLGFRGEGLASIAAVARVTLISRTVHADVATAVDAFGEEIGEARPLAGPLGTRVVVRDLFANVPVRREYLRSSGAEFGRIASWLATLALAYPHVGFSLEHDGKTAFTFAPGDDMAARLRHVFGMQSSTMVPVRSHERHAAVSGWVSSPGDDRPDRRNQILFVNGRLLRSTLVSGAWSAAYRTFAMVGRHPYGVLYLQVPPNELDPNVHPTKSDVRLRHGDRVVGAVKDAIVTALRRGAVERLERSISFAPSAHALGGATATAAWAESFLPDGDADAGGSALRVLAQVDRTFILATDGDAVVLIDQHAAHERIVFEQLAANARAHAAAEPLLIPYTFEVRPDEADKLDASLDALAAGGLQIEHFGERAYRVVATPARMVHAGRTRPFDVADFVTCLSDDVRGLDAEQRVWASLACHSVVVAGEQLAYPEMTALVERLVRCENPMNCPHGRPTIVRLEPEQIARLFKRV
ncbi:DNA mismatch repair protein MutL [Vulcanimicrobium alpinum]|uniref:DNA mismatch repair protein MutL n=1 Tax=Vulcanimicrobium alpinum TaxID=3016050 RepID=A0AAN2C8S6_UNVUL|nr:DNA mismatch repair endonuclease MutL [Vulcanimicrobium alpinum]BDE05805.1 DNA mismatch repair protein MutL [Vulcanimicrobium alpinum]